VTKGLFAYSTDAEAPPALIRGRLEARTVLYTKAELARILTLDAYPRSAAYDPE
jgi:hypothetical protein